MQDAWRAYLELGLGLTEASRKKAQQAAKRLVDSTGGTAGQLQALAEELVSTSAANREALTKLVRVEVDRALGVMGVATAEQVAELTARVRELEQDLREAQARAAAEAPAAGGTAGEVAAAEGSSSAASRLATKQAVAKKAVARKAVARKAVAKKAVARKAPGEGTGAA